MTSPTSTPRDPTASLYHAASASAFTALGAAGITAAAWATLIVVGVGAALGGLDLAITLALGQLCLVVVPAVAARIGGKSRLALGLARTSWLYAIAAVLIGGTAFGGGKGSAE